MKYFYPTILYLTLLMIMLSNFSASDLGKAKPGQWIPVYYVKDISEYLQENKSSTGKSRAGGVLFFIKVQYFLTWKGVDF